MTRAPTIAEQLDEHERTREIAAAVREADRECKAEVAMREREFVLTIIAVMHAAGLKRLPVLQRHLIEANFYTLTRHEDPSLPGHVFTITSEAP